MRTTVKCKQKASGRNRRGEERRYEAFLAFAGWKSHFFRPSEASGGFLFLLVSEIGCGMCRDTPWLASEGLSRRGGGWRRE